MSTVLGTRLATANDDARGRCFLLSDLHLQAEGGFALEAFEAVLRAAAARPLDTRVLILGDLFDVWVGDGQARLPRWDEAVSALTRCAAAGVSLTLLHGNRDFMLDERFAARTGCRVVAGGLRLRLGGRDTLCLHGDELCLRDLDYQRAKRILRGRTVRSLLRLMPVRVGLSLGAGARKKSQAVIRRQPDQSRFDPTREAIDAAFGSGAELLVFGHIHRWARGEVAVAGGRSAEYCILPAFDEAGVHLRHEDGRLGFFGPDGRPVQDPPAREFD